MPHPGLSISLSFKALGVCEQPTSSYTYTYKPTPLTMKGFTYNPKFEFVRETHIGSGSFLLGF